MGLGGLDVATIYRNRNSLQEYDQHGRLHWVMDYIPDQNPDTLFVLVRNKNYNNLLIHHFYLQPEWHP
jgi:hypothetical protein